MYIIGPDHMIKMASMNIYSKTLINLLHNLLRRVMRKQTFWYLTWSDTNQPVQLQKMARGLKFRI